MKNNFILLVFLSIFLTSCGSRVPSTNRLSSNNTAHSAPTTRASLLADADTLGGGFYQNKLDREDRKIMEQRSPSTLQRVDEGSSLTVNDVIELSQAGVSDDVILGYLRESRSTFKLNQEQIYLMQNSGVSQRVINYMIDTGY